MTKLRTTTRKTRREIDELKHEVVIGERLRITSDDVKTMRWLHEFVYDRTKWSNDKATASLRLLRRLAGRPFR